MTSFRCQVCGVTLSQVDSGQSHCLACRSVKEGVTSRATETAIAEGAPDSPLDAAIQQPAPCATAHLTDDIDIRLHSAEADAGRMDSAASTRRKIAQGLAWSLLALALIFGGTVCWLFSMQLPEAFGVTQLCDGAGAFLLCAGLICSVVGRARCLAISWESDSFRAVFASLFFSFLVTLWFIAAETLGGQDGRESAARTTSLAAAAFLLPLAEVLFLFFLRSEADALGRTDLAGLALDLVLALGVWCVAYWTILFERGLDKTVATLLFITARLAIVLIGWLVLLPLARWLTRGIFFDDAAETGPHGLLLVGVILLVAIYSLSPNLRKDLGLMLAILAPPVYVAANAFLLDAMRRELRATNRQS